MIFICIPVFNRIDFTRKCLETIRQQSYKEYLVIVCNDGSSDDTADVLASEFPDTIVIPGDGNLWWTGGINECVNYALKVAKSDDYIFTLNNDTELLPNTLQKLIQFASFKSNTIIACGNYFINDKSKLESTAFCKKSKGIFPEYHKPLFTWGEDASKLKKDFYEVSSVSGKGVLIPIKIFLHIGVYNSDKLPHYHADTEFTRRAFQFGYKIYFVPNAVVYTHQDASGIGQVNSKVSISEFFRSFFSMRSENHLQSLYNRSRLIYGRKWFLYLVPNLASIFIKFVVRYIRAIMKKP